MRARLAGDIELEAQGVDVGGAGLAPGGHLAGTHFTPGWVEQLDALPWRRRPGQRLSAGEDLALALALFGARIEEEAHRKLGLARPDIARKV